MFSIVRATPIATLILALAAGSASAQQPAPKFAYINSQAILQSAPGRAEAQAQFEREMAAFQQQVKRMGDSLSALVAAYDSTEITLSPTARQARQKQIQTREEEYQQRTRQLEQRAQARQVELLQPIMERITRVLEEIRAEENYTMIFDAGSAAGVIVAADKNLDITEKVLARLRTTSQNDKAAAPTRPSGAPQAQPSGVTRPRSPRR